jgi:DNA-binding SARP family transcriptional activator/tetratricopeptide (TPR) repeat protein
MSVGGFGSRQSTEMLASSPVALGSDAILTHGQSFPANSGGADMIELRSLGNAEIDTGASTLSPSQEIVFGAALYLILERGNRISRNELASLLWPAVPEKARAHRLRQTILQLKKLGVAVRADRDNLSLSDREVSSDVDALSSPDSLESLDYRSLAFLPGYCPRFSEPLRDWLDSKRSAVHAAATRILVHQLEHSRLQADWATVEKTGAKVLALDEYNEAAVLACAEAAAMRGGKREAVSILDRYISEVGSERTELRLPATLLRRRIVERIPDRPPVLNGDPPFVGREAQMEVLTESFMRARAGAGSATLIIGEPGIGKSRLSAELGRFAELQGAAVQRATCRRTDIDRPLSLFVDIVPQLRELPGALGCAPDTFAALKRLTEFEQRPGGFAHPGDSEILFQGIRTALFDLVDSLADERCLVLLIEDIQWLDNASGKILAQMIEWTSSKRVFFLLNSRPGINGLDALTDSVLVRTLHLGPLTKICATTLLRSLAQQTPQLSDASFIDRSLAVAEGNPFFLQELAHHWSETGGRYEAPPSVAKVLHERLARLSREALHVLQTCAVLGECATIDRVDKVLGYQPHMLLAAIEELSNAAMLSSPNQESDSANSQLQPRHDFLSSTAIRRLAPLSLAFLHRRAADVLEPEIAQEIMPTTLLWACASHRHNAGDRERALFLTMSCAEHLLEVGLAHDAALAFQRSMEYCVADAQRLKLLPRLAVAQELDSDWDKSNQTLAAAVKLAAKENPTSGQHNTYELLLLEARRRRGYDFTDLLYETMRCVEQKTASAAHRIGAAITATKVATDFGRTDYIDAVYDQVLPLFNSPGVSEQAQLELQIIYRTLRGKEAVQLEDLQRFADLVRTSEGELAYSHALQTSATVCRHSARYREGLEFLSAASDHATVNRLHARLPELSLAFARLHIAAGEFKKAGEALPEASKQANEGNAALNDELHFMEARLAVETGDITRAVAALKCVVEPISAFSVSRRGYYYALEIHIRLAQRADVGDVSSLVAELERAHCQVRALGQQDFEAYALFLGLRYIGQLERATERLREYSENRRARWPLPQAIRDALRSSRSGGRNFSGLGASSSNA